MPEIARIGIRLEDKNEWEARVPLTPQQVGRLIREHGLSFTLQSSRTRAFADGEYRTAGASVSDRLDDCPVIFAVKEIPLDLLEAGKTYMYFSHVIKGQEYNMPMLARLMKLGCTLIDYEKVCDKSGRRLIFFGFHAGLAGMIETLWALGQRLGHLGFETALSDVRHAYEYNDLADVRDKLTLIGAKIKNEGLPDQVCPLVVGFAGYGNVSRGAQDVLTALPLRDLEPGQLNQEFLDGLATNTLYRVVFREEDMVSPKEKGKAFDLAEYYEHPERFDGVFENYLPHLSVLVNCIYWTDKYPRLLTKDWLKSAWPAAGRKLQVIGDISCDHEGAVECTIDSTTPGDPAFVYHPDTGAATPGIEGNGVVVMAVDNLPCELPRESSASFGEALSPFVPAIAAADYSKSFEELDLPDEIKRAVIVHKGELTGDFKYLEKYVAKFR